MIRDFSPNHPPPPAGLSARRIERVCRARKGFVWRGLPVKCEDDRQPAGRCCPCPCGYRGIPCRAGLPCYTARMTNVDLTQDCASCAALCCAALPFDSGAQFAIDKPAAAPCPHLSADARCTIHAGLADAGFGGGQRVTQEMFGGRSWQDDPSLVAPMFNAFQDALRVHNLLVLLEEAAKLPLPDPAGCAALRAALTPDGPLTTDWLHTVLAGDIQPRVMAYLQTLRGVARP